MEKKGLESMKTTIAALGTGLLLLSFGGQVLAQSIGSGAFGVGAVVDDFTGLGLPFSNVGSLVRPEGIYTFDTTTFRYLDFGGGYSFGEAIGNDSETGFIDVVLNNPAIRAGGWIGASASKVDFFDASNLLLGSVTTPDLDNGPIFAGWQSLSNPIKRIRFNDTDVDGQIIVIDRITTEQVSTVPEPGSIALLTGLSVSGGLFAFRRLRRSK